MATPTPEPGTRWFVAASDAVEYARGRYFQIRSLLGRIVVRLTYAVRIQEVSDAAWSSLTAQFSVCVGLSWCAAAENWQCLNEDVAEICEPGNAAISVMTRITH